MATERGRLPRRNVEVFDSEGAVSLVHPLDHHDTDFVFLNPSAGFWQYGTLRWDEFYRHITAFVLTKTDWTIFHYDTSQRHRGAPCQPSNEVVHPGHYIMLSSAGEPIPVAGVFTLPRPRNITLSNTSACGSQYRARGRARDEQCLITALRTQTYSRLKVAHIFPRAHDTEWIRKGYPSKITDPADEADMGGPIKIDSVQNVITLRSDLHDAWDNYEFGVDPTNNYRITSFTNGNADINGLHLQLDHIQDPRLRPLDDLFTDHFMQGLFKHMKGSGEVGWTHEDYDDAFGDGSFNLSNAKIWDTEEGKKHLELALADRLFDHRLLQQQETTV